MQPKSTLLKYAVLGLLSVVLSFGTSVFASGPSNISTVKFNKEYKIKRTSGIVTVYKLSEQGQKIEYDLDQFSSDVVLLVYRRISEQGIVDSLAKQYRISKQQSRRNVKASLNVLEEWDIILRKE